MVQLSGQRIRWELAPQAIEIHRKGNSGALHLGASRGVLGFVPLNPTQRETIASRQAPMGITSAESQTRLAILEAGRTPGAGLEVDPGARR